MIEDSYDLRSANVVDTGATGQESSKDTGLRSEGERA